MATDVTLKASGILKKKLDFNKVKELLPSSFSYGVYNQVYVLKDLDQNTNFNQYIVAYNRYQIGRGFQLYIQDYEIQLSLPLPCTRQDIEMFYESVKIIADAYRAKTFIQDEITLNLDQLDFVEAEQKKFISDYVLQIFEMDTPKKQILPVALYPITVDFEELFQSVEEKDRLEVFEDYIYSRQDEEIFYPSQSFFQKKDESKIFGSYSLLEDVKTVLPYEPKNIFVQNLGDDIEWILALGSVEDDEYVSHDYIKYSDFLKILDGIEKEVFDAGHFSYEMSREDLKEFKKKAITLEEI